MFRQKTFGMELHPKHRQRFVPDGHDLATAIRCIGPRRDDEIGVERIGTNDQTVIARRGERIRQADKKSRVVMMDAIDLAVHQLLRTDNDAPCCLAD